MFKQLFILIVIAALAASVPVEREGRIVGGTNAPLGRFPYMASMRTLGNRHYCGGVIVNNRWVLSAAHCTFGEANNAVRVVVGTVTLNSGGAAFTSSRVVNHPGYDEWSLINDISVVQTSTAMTFTVNIQPIALGSAVVGGGVNAIVTGWGTTSASATSLPNNLQQLSTTTLTNADCQARSRPADRPYIFNSKICTFTRTGQGFCSGDSGGPLAANNQVIGLVIWVPVCGGGFPDVYTRVSSFRTWIINNTQ